MLACNKLGVLANFLNPLFTAEQTNARINDTDARVVTVDGINAEMPPRVYDLLVYMMQ